MTTSAIVLRPSLPEFAIVDAYYRAAPHEPTQTGSLPVDSVAPFGTSFHALLDAMLAKKRSHIVVVSHGNSDSGLLLPVTSKTDITIGSVIELLLKLVDSIGTDGVTADPEALRASAHDMGLPKETVLRIAQKCWTIRHRPIAVQLHIRGCDIGANRHNLRQLQRLLVSRVVSAPDCSMLYTMVEPLKAGKGPVTDVVAWGKKTPVVGRRFIYTRLASAGIGPMLLDLEYLGTKSDSQAAVQSTADIAKWATIFHEHPSPATTRTFPVAALYPYSGNNYFLPHEPVYRERIVTVTMD